MNFVSTRDSHIQCHFMDAVLSGLAPDGGLFVPEKILSKSPQEINTLLSATTLQQVGLELLIPFFPDISEADLFSDLMTSLHFDIPLIQLYPNIFLLEVFHGPTLSFKDVGARFMAQMISRLLQKEKQKNVQLNILVATSGDTGSAVASAFYQVPHVKVYVLYPTGRITSLQEQQIATFDQNIFPIEVMGTFDECQLLVKNILQDKLFLQIQQKNNIFYSTANSINIARLLPQMIYHTWGVAQLKQQFNLMNPVMCVPSGNLGNLVSAIYAHACGIPMKHFIAAINDNVTFVEYLATGHFVAHPSLKTFSSAMDVGNPSNFERLMHFYQHSIDKIRADVSAVSVNNQKTVVTIRDVYQQTGYVADPHTAVGIAVAKEMISLKNIKQPIIVTATAHPAKFPEIIRLALGDKFVLPIPERLQTVLAKPKVSQKISADLSQLRELIV